MGQQQGTAETPIAARQDLAEQAMETGDLDGAAAQLAQAAALLRSDLVFGWRLELKQQLLTGRLALRRGDAERALTEAGQLAARATTFGVPRYVSVARLLAHRANRAMGLPVDLAVVDADLDLLDGSVAIEAWRWTCELAAEFGHEPWRDRAADRVARLAQGAGRYADGLRREADRQLSQRPTGVRPGPWAIGGLTRSGG